MNQDDNQSYEFKIRILGNEIFAIALASTSISGRWIGIALISIFTTMAVLGAYGEKLVTLYRSLIATG